jgi:hypothetical protein
VPPLLSIKGHFNSWTLPGIEIYSVDGLDRTLPLF